MNNKVKYTLEDHICRKCGGRVLKQVSGGGPTPGGNPIFKCADCGVTSSGLDASVICWCGFTHRNNIDNPFMCLPFSEPNVEDLFKSCGYDLPKGEVGIVLSSQYYERLTRRASK